MSDSERTIVRLIAAEQFAELNTYLPTYSAAVPPEAGDVLNAVNFLRAAIMAVKARKAHLVEEHIKLSGARKYTDVPHPETGDVDFVG